MRQGAELVLVPTVIVTTIVADGPRSTIRTTTGETHTFSYPLKALAEHLNPTEFIRLGRGVLANINRITRITAVANGTNRIVFDDGREFRMSRIQSRRLRSVLSELLSL